jgi:putative transposase
MNFGWLTAYPKALLLFKNKKTILAETTPMPTPEEYKAPFYFQQHYHVLFRSIDGVLLFKNEREHIFFLEKWKRFTQMIADVWAYSLLDNHVHLIIKTKTEEEITAQLQQLGAEQKTKAIEQFLKTPSEDLFRPIMERQINSFLVSYTNTYNNFIQRKGGLFQQPFRRLLIADDAHLQQAIIYTHANAQKHGLVKNFLEHRRHSYHTIMNNDSGFVNTTAVLDFFGGKLKFEEAHKQQIDYFYGQKGFYSPFE